VKSSDQRPIARADRARIGRAVCALVFVAPVAALAQTQAQTQTAEPAEPPRDPISLPGSLAAPGLSLSPEAPPTPPPPGGAAPAFGTRSDPEAWTFRVGGRISGFGQVGIGRTPSYAADSGSVFHTPPRILGRSPIYVGPGATLNFQYSNQTVTTFVSLETSSAATEWRGYQASQYGPRIRTAYVAVNPPPIADLRLRIQVGAFPANYGAPGPWGWGLFGPVLAVHGYGGLATGNYELAPNVPLNLEYGLSGVPLVDEATPRGTYTDWPEAGISTIVHHAHVGVSLENRYFAKLHLARAVGRNERRYLDDDPATPGVVERRPDGRMDVAALETRVVADPYGQLGITPVYWRFKDALSVHDGIWWALDWTAGGREMTNKFLGPQSGGNGQIAAVSIEYDFSLRRILAAPQPFDGNGQDLRVALAFEPYWTLKSTDPNYNQTSGYYVGASLEHVILPWLSTTYYLYGESRDAATVDTAGNAQRGRWVSFSGTVGLALHSSWQSQDRIALAYSRYFYSSFTDNNPALPLDRDVLTLGGSVAF